ncbi:MAG: STAS domain-containing protein, partial [Oscillochloris sp.]|nr:STAS domain-containing protein [Oscillochloris sp.]
VYQIPIALAGLLGGRRLLVTVSTYSICFMLLTGLLQSMHPPLAGIFSAATMAAIFGGTATLPNVWPPLIFFIAATLLISLMLNRFGEALHGALSEALDRETELEGIRGSLEVVIGERTAELQATLGNLHQHADEQARLLAENAQQRDFIREMSVPVLPISNTTLVMPLIGALDSGRLIHIQEQALSHLEATSARHLLLDITGVPVVDTQVAQGLIRVVQAARLLGTTVILVGIRPEVAQSIVGLGIDLSGIHTHSTLQSALGQVGG